MKSNWFIADRAYPNNIINTTIAAWAPYFDDIDAIIFLAPISCFDQVLAEDHLVNRLVRLLISVSDLLSVSPNFNTHVGRLRQPLDIRCLKPIIGKHEPRPVSE